jgi:cytochrome c oxidase cbb3-type subunit 3
MVAAGGEMYQAVCAACHGDQGQGVIGPNLTDPYWIHGGTTVDIFTVISDGILSAGMPAWSAQYSPEERAQITAFVASLEGTDPPGAKAPQGELVEQ